MVNARTIGLLAGFLFGVVWVWQGAGDALLVLLFAALGVMVGFVIWFIGRIATGEVDMEAIRELASVLLSGRKDR